MKNLDHSGKEFSKACPVRLFQRHEFCTLSQAGGERDDPVHPAGYEREALAMCTYLGPRG